MNEQKLEDIRSYYDNNDTSALMEDAERVDLGDVADPDATVAFTESMPNRVLRGAREIAAAEGVSTNDVLRRFVAVDVPDAATPRPGFDTLGTRGSCQRVLSGCRHFS